MSPKEIFSQLSLWIVNLYLKSYIFCLHFNLYLHVWIRIRIPNTDPYFEYGSGSGKLPNTGTDPILIWIHNTVKKIVLDPDDFNRIRLFSTESIRIETKSGSGSKIGNTPGEGAGRGRMGTVDKETPPPPHSLLIFSGLFTSILTFLSVIALNNIFSDANA